MRPALGFNYVAAIIEYKIPVIKQDIFGTIAIKITNIVHSIENQITIGTNKIR